MIGSAQRMSETDMLTVTAMLVIAGILIAMAFIANPSSGPGMDIMHKVFGTIESVATPQ